ncbi:unnamed protein product [Psylliodes chrysocephalus]|uniref:Uncharacterized protein n=1 Tax=Psylliodes chrysocephalus TaxID=3402493 RepID=A0A9P0G8T9_9CUCU|nr:unnamed protein product [Psylliodes chrysocephala]
MIPMVSQKKFLCNAENKSRLITMLMAKGEEAGIACRQANEDAECDCGARCGSAGDNDGSQYFSKRLSAESRERKSASVAVPTTVCSKTKSCQEHNAFARDECMRLDDIFV